MKTIIPFCLTLIILIGSAGMSKSAEPINGFCLSGTQYSHLPIAGKCSASYEKGDYETALREFKPLAEQGNAAAQYNLGQMYRRGQGVPHDYKTAVKWYRLAAEQGNAYAQTNLGNRYRSGQGVPVDYKTAEKWFRLAAEQGIPHAQNNLGGLYHIGQGVLKDYVYAHMWLSIAAISAEGMNASKYRDIVAERRDFVAKQMTPSQLEKAQDLARECIRKKFKGC